MVTNVAAETTVENQNAFPEIKEGDPCVPNKIYRMDCNSCRCGANNNLLCTKMACISKNYMDKVLRKIQNRNQVLNSTKMKKVIGNINKKTKSFSKNKLMRDRKEVKIIKKKISNEKKQKVNAGKKKRKSNVQKNKDRNVNRNDTKLEEQHLKTQKGEKTDIAKNIREVKTNFNKEDHKDDKHSVRSDTKVTTFFQKESTSFKQEFKKETDNYKRFPDLPEGKCIPGKIYQNDCFGCYCKDSKTAVCSEKKLACDPDRPPQVPLDVRPAFTEAEREDLPSLPHMASRCEPGRSYRVNCNTCICLPNRSLFCDKLLCLSQDDMNRLEAKKITGTPCQRDTDIETPPCVNCTCDSGKAKCEHRVDCQPGVLRKQYQKVKPVLVLDMDKDEKCMPKAVYKSDCNKCYCQKDGSMRCTLKVCLNYVQSLKLKKHRLYLQKHGL